MVVTRSKNPADLVKYYTDQIMEERAKLMESLANISEYAEQLRKITQDAGQRLLERGKD